MKRISLLLSVIVLMLFGTISAGAISGEGTAENPYNLYTADDMFLISDFPSKHFKLMKDVTVNANLGTFSGVLDGNGYTISCENVVFEANKGTIKNVTVNLNGFDTMLTKSNYQGGVIDSCKIFNGQIATTNSGIIVGTSVEWNEKITVEKVSYNFTTIDFVGGICNMNDSTGIIENSSFEAENIFITTMYEDQSVSFGSIAGENYGYISQCYAKTLAESVNNENKSVFFDGIAWNRPNGKISNCYFMGKMKDGPDKTIIHRGIGSNGSISNCYCVFAIENCGVTQMTNFGVGTPDNTFRCYYQGDDSEVYSDAGGTVKSANAMKMKETYLEWNFSTIWGIEPEVNNGYPYLKENLPSDYIRTKEIFLSDTEVELKKGDVYSIDATLLPDNATIQRILWTSSNENVAKVINGQVVALEVGTATIGAEAVGSDAKAVCIISVVDEGSIDEGTEVPDDTEKCIVEVENIKTQAGKAITVPIVIKNNQGIAGFKLKISYDSNILSPTSIEMGEVLTQGTITTNMGQGEEVSELGCVSVLWTNTADITENGELLRVTFNVSENALDGEYKIGISYEEGDVTNQKYEDIALDIKDGAVEVISVIFGDVLCDGKVNTKDAVRLSQYLADWKMELSSYEAAAADIYADGVINTKDSVKLSQYLAEWK